MGYDLIPNNKKLENFRFSIFRWPKIINICGYLFLCRIDGSGNWRCTFGPDKRMGDDYPLIMTNDGFRITSNEANIMRRLISNYLKIECNAEKNDLIEHLKEFIVWLPKSKGFRIT